MKIFVTGSRGRVGACVSRVLADAGHEVVGFDLVDGDDVLDALRLTFRMRGCDAVVHAAGLLEPDATDRARLVRVNVEGTRHALDAAATLGVRRFVFVGSAAATGVFKGERLPDYLPLDEAHPSYATSAYSSSKREGELLCERAARESRLSVGALCPPGVWTEATYPRILAARLQNPAYEWSPFWEYGAFVDVRDLATAVRAATEVNPPGCRRMFVASSDVTTSGRASRQLAQALMPSVEWRGDASHDADPFRTLLCIDEARRRLGWEPEFTWRRFLSDIHS